MKEYTIIDAITDAKFMMDTSEHIRTGQKVVDFLNTFQSEVDKRVRETIEEVRNQVNKIGLINLMETREEQDLVTRTILEHRKAVLNILTKLEAGAE
jgi:hypothetical protein